MRRRGEIPAVYFFLASYVAGLLLVKAGLFFLPVFLLAFCHRKVFKGIGLCSLALSLGALNVYLQQPRQDRRHYLNAEMDKYLRIQITGEPEARERTFRAEARLLATGNDTFWQERSGKIRLYFSKDTTLVLPRLGDCLVCKGEIRPIEGFVGRDSLYFDYAAFMAKKNIYGQVFLRSDAFYVEPVELSPLTRLKRTAGSLRGHLLCFWDHCGLAENEMAVAKALVLGERGNSVIEEAYRKSGVIHVLAVSGMHLSIFSCLVAGALGFLQRKAWQRWLRFLLVALCVWGYALLTGLSPSVCRAASMFCFVGFGKCMGRDVKSIRSVAVSALFLLVLYPGLLQDVGFLLSYAAVAGLIFLTPLVERFWQPRQKALRFFRDLAVSSVSAQMATLPICLCVFGAFPTYFLIGNCLVSPMVNIALPLGIAVTALVFVWQAAAFFTAGIFGWLLRVMNAAVLTIQDWPAAMLHLSIPLFAAVWLYGTIACFWRSFSRFSVLELRRAMVLLLGFCWIA